MMTVSNHATPAHVWGCSPWDHPLTTIKIQANLLSLLPQDIVRLGWEACPALPQNLHYVCNKLLNSLLVNVQQHLNLILGGIQSCDFWVDTTIGNATKVV